MGQGKNRGTTGLIALLFGLIAAFYSFRLHRTPEFLAGLRLEYSSFWVSQPFSVKETKVRDAPTEEEEWEILLR